MKKSLLTSAFLLLMAISFNAKAWNIINSGTVYNLNSICFTDANTGYVVGSVGTILKTTDAGQTWTALISGTPTTLNAVFFVNSNIGYVVGGTNTSSTILKTIDGGLTWITQTCSAGKLLKSVCFSDINNGYAVGYSGTIVKTIDGGTTWTILTSSVTNVLSAVRFINNNTGFAVGTTGILLKTIDAGITWSQETSGTTKNLNTIFFVNNNIGFIGGLSGTLLKTTNGGISWTTQTITNSYNISTLFFTNNQTGYATCGNIIKTTDGGLSWIEQATDENSLCVSICFVTDSIGFAVGGSGTILKTTIGGGYAGSDYLSANNINALFHTNGNLFFDLPFGGAKFEVPKGSGKATIFSGGLWVGGLDNSGVLHLACEKYRQNGIDYFAGPIMDSIYYSQEQEKWNRIWKVSRSEVENHILNWSTSGYVAPRDLAEWPGNGDPSKGQSLNMAPFYDNNNDGIYTPQQGDYPLIKGDEAMFFVFNDDMKEHTEGDGNKLGIEIHAMAYAFNCPQDSAFWNTLFLNYEIINRSTNTYNSTYIGAFTDFDIGDPNDDYIGCDVQRGSFYGCNGNALDGSGLGNSYGANPPAQSVTILGGPFMDANGSDYGYSGIANGCDESINGLNFNDGIIDNERFGMSKFLYFNNSSSVLGDPKNATECYNILKGYWRNGVQMTYGGTGYDSLFQMPPANFMFPGFPSSDSCGWGTGGALQTGWSEITQQNSPADRRGVASMGPFTMVPGEINKIDMAFVYGRDFINPAPEAAITVVQQRIDSIRYGFLHNISPCGPFDQGIKENKIKEEILVYPNPANDYFEVNIKNNSDNKMLTIYTIEGTKVKQFSFTGNQTRVFTDGLSNGMYIVEVQTKRGSQFKKVIVAK